MIGSDHGDSTSSEDAFEAGRPRVLFLCSRNAARSQIAEALLFNLLGAEVVVASAGATAAMEVDPMTFDVLDDFGIEWRSHRPKRFSEVMASRWDVVITLCEEARESCPVLPGFPALAHWPIEDPAAVNGAKNTRKAAFGRVVRQLERRIRALVYLLPEMPDHELMEARLAAIDRVDRDGFR